MVLREAPPGAPLYAYVRVSHMGRRKADDPDFHSVDDQVDEIKRWARTHGHEVDYSLPPELDAKSDNPNRAVLRRAIDGVHAGTHRGIVVAYQSRSGRDLRMMLDVWHEVEDVAGGEFWTARENLNGKTRQGRLTRSILGAVDEDQLHERRESFAALRKWTAEQGIWRARIVPRGYDKDTDKASPTWRHLVPNGHAAQVVDAFRAVVRGTPVSRIAGDLGMTPSGARRLLANRVYLGEVIDGQHANLAAHTPIIDLGLFDSVQAILATNPRPGRRHDGAPALLAGLVKCAACGYAMPRARAKVEIYRCSVSHSGQRCPRPAAIACTVLDAHVEGIAVPEFERIRHLRRRGWDGLADADAAAAAAHAELKAFIEATSALNNPAFAVRAKTLADNAADADDVLAAARARQPALPGPTDAVESYLALKTSERRNRALRALLSAVVVRAVGRGHRVAVEDRARVLRFGAPRVGVDSKHGGTVGGLVPIAFDDLEGMDVLGL